MTDLTKCANHEKCPLASTCRRAIAPSDDVHQSYACFYIEGEDCGEYWGIEGEPFPQRSLN